MPPEKKREPSIGEPKTCPECSGRGWTDNLCITVERAYRCSYCNGKGFDAAGKECYACRGTGLIEVRREDKSPCPLCQGAGIYPVPESMTIERFAFHPGKRSIT
jgi:RecJ-like exonuclease